MTTAFGDPRYELAANNALAKFDELTLIGGPCTTIRLPKAYVPRLPSAREKLGDSLLGRGCTLTNIATSAIEVRCASGDHIGSRNVDLLAPKEIRRYVVIGDGVWACLGDAPEGLYDDMRFPAQAINTPGGAGSADRSTSTGMLLFDKGLVEQVEGAVQLPHDWIEGSPIEPHIHYRGISDPAGATSGHVWQFDYKWVNVHDYFPAAFSTIGEDFDVSDFVSAEARHDTGSLGKISGTNKRVSSMIEWKLSRVATDGYDDYNDDIELLEFDIHYLRRWRGSVAQYGDQIAP